MSHIFVLDGGLGLLLFQVDLLLLFLDFRLFLIDFKKKFIRLLT